MDAFKIQGFDSKTKSTYDEFLIILLRQVLPDFRRYVDEKIRLKKKMTGNFIFTGLFIAIQGALIVPLIQGYVKEFILNIELFGSFGVIFPYFFFFPSILWLILLIAGLRKRSKLKKLNYTAPVSRIGKSVVNFTQYPFGDGSLIIDEEGLFPLEHVSCPYLDDADEVQRLWDSYIEKIQNLPAVLASINRYAVEIPKELDVEESFLYDTETTLHELYDEIEKAFKAREFATIDMGILESSDELTDFIAKSDYGHKSSSYINTDLIREKLEKIQGIKWDQMVGTIAEELPEIVEEELHAAVQEAEVLIAAEIDDVAEITITPQESEEVLEQEPIEASTEEPVEATPELSPEEEKIEEPLTPVVEREQPEEQVTQEIEPVLQKTSWSVDEFSDNVIKKVLKDMAKISLLRNHSVKNIVATIEPRLSDIMHFGAYNFYCPYCHEKDIEKLLKQDFNALKEGSTDPISWNEHARVFLKDWKDDVWKCNLCERETRHPIPVHKLLSSVFMPAYNYLLQENEKERIRVYSKLNVKKIDYRQAYEKERDEIERDNRREIDSQVLSIQTMRAQVESIGDVIESMESLMIKINAVAENRLDSVKEYAHSVEEKIITENNAIVQQVRNDVAELRNQTHATLQKLSYQEKIEDLERDRVQQETLKQLEELKDTSLQQVEQTAELIKSAAMMVSQSEETEAILPVAGALDLAGKRQSELEEHPGYEIDKAIEHDFWVFKDLITEEEPTEEGRA